MTEINLTSHELDRNIQNDLSSDKEEEEEGGMEPLLCTFAATGPRMSFQSIYNCQTCMTSSSSRNSKNSTLEDTCCICESCAKACHEDHDVHFLGYAPAYCDCAKDNNDRCGIISQSREIASKMGIPAGGKRPEGISSASSNPFGYEVKEFEIGNDYEESKLCHEMLRQAEVAATLNDNASVNRTYWISNQSRKNENLCELEIFALEIFQRHTTKLNMAVTKHSGAEWWVQVKQPSQSYSKKQMLGNYSPVDLHYDKDEAMAATFGLGYFPSLSTVTYLTTSTSANPTLIFPQTYHDPQDRLIDQVIISRSKNGKHIVFDGRLLHGAPKLNLTAAPDNAISQSHSRVTFLVNIWLYGKPLEASSLSKDEREIISKDRVVDFIDDIGRIIQLNEQSSIPCCTVGEFNANADDRTSLPFISTEADWIDDESEEGVRVSMVIPPSTFTASTYRAKFEPLFEARYTGIDDDEDTAFAEQPDNQKHIVIT